MANIPDTIKNISQDIQCTFEELIKLLIRKSLRPALNPLNANTKVVYNTHLGKYERGYLGSASDDSVNKYIYLMTHECLGWTNEILTNFKVMAKFIKNNTVSRFPAVNTKTHNQLKSRSRVAFTEREGKQHLSNNRVPSTTQYKNFLSILSSKTMSNIIANKKAAFTYTTDVPYTHSFKELESVGRDIIDQTDPSICGSDSAKMSTSMLRAKMHNLEERLANLSVDYPNIYDAYIEMLRIINSVPRNKFVWVINLIAAMTYQRWTDLPQNQKITYLETLGEDFICAFNDNELITILLQSDTSELILTSCYLYSLLKMLFIVFGYSKLVPIVTETCSESSQELNKAHLRKHLEKYRGASYRRGDPRELIIEEEVYPHADQNDAQWSEHYIDDNGNPTKIINRTNLGLQEQFDPLATETENHNIYRGIEPVDQCIYDYIKLFGDLYPTLIDLMGGTESFPPETIQISCTDIPPTYDYLATVPEFLWRFNDYSYCRYLEYVASKQLNYAISSKVNSKARYLHSM